MEIWRRRIIVADEDLDFENEELTEARKIELILKLVKMFLKKKLIDLGRRAILALRQNLISKIHEHDNTNLYKQFKDLIGEIYTAEVHHVCDLELF
jgi:N utilization substance protein A